MTPRDRYIVDAVRYHSGRFTGLPLDPSVLIHYLLNIVSIQGLVQHTAYVSEGQVILYGARQPIHSGHNNVSFEVVQFSQREFKVEDTIFFQFKVVFQVFFDTTIKSKMVEGQW